MLKFIFWLLILANGALFAYQQGYLGRFFPDGREPARAARQLNADSIRLIPAGAASAPAESPAPASALIAPVTMAAPEKTACIEFGNFDVNEAKRIEPRLAAWMPSERISRRSVPDGARHIILIPPLADKDSAEKKAGELRSLGVTDFYIIQDNPELRWGISLGVFKFEEAARAQLAALNQKGVRSARLMPYSGGAQKIAFQLRAPEAEAQGARQKLKADFPQQEIRECGAASM